MALCEYGKCDVDNGTEYCPECLRDAVANRELGRNTPAPVQTADQQQQVWDAIQIVSKRLKEDSRQRIIAHQTTLTIQCAWCGRDMGQKDGKGQSGVSHGICDHCIEKMGLAPPQ